MQTRIKESFIIDIESTMGLSQSKYAIHPNNAEYDSLLKLAKPELQQLVKSIEDTMAVFCVRPTSVWYFNVGGKRIIVPAAVFLKVFKQYCVRDYLTTEEGGNTIIQFVHEGKSV
jgi:hypothetical protein